MKAILLVLIGAASWWWLRSRRYPPGYPLRTLPEKTRQHYRLQAALAGLEPPEPELWHEPNETVRAIRRTK